MAQRGTTGWRVGGTMLVVVCTVLLVSMGGAIVAAPLTLPLLYRAVQRWPARSFRIAATVIGALTVGEVVWAITYLSIREQRPWIWGVPLLFTIAGGWFYTTIAPPEPARVRS